MENRTTIFPETLANAKVMAAAGHWALWMTPAHLAAASLLVLMFLVSVFLALQYACKYRKYQVAEDLDSLTDNSSMYKQKKLILFCHFALRQSYTRLYYHILYLMILHGKKNVR